jgi:flagellar biogenesis protein FliO
MGRPLFIILCLLGLLAGPAVWLVDSRSQNLPKKAPVAVEMPMQPVPGEGTSAEPFPDLKVTSLKAVAFLTTLATIGGLLVFLKKRGGFFPTLRRTSQIAVEDTLHLGTRHYLAIVKCDQKRFLLGITSQSISTIGQLNDGTENSGKKVFHQLKL